MAVSGPTTIEKEGRSRYILFQGRRRANAKLFDAVLVAQVAQDDVAILNEDMARFLAATGADSEE